MKFMSQGHANNPRYRESIQASEFRSEGMKNQTNVHKWLNYHPTLSVMTSSPPRILSASQVGIRRRGLKVAFDGAGAIITNLFNIGSLSRSARRASKQDHSSTEKSNVRRVRHTMVSRCGEQIEVMAGSICRRVSLDKSISTYRSCVL